MVQDAEPVSFAMMDFNRLLQSGASKPYSHCRGSDGGHETLSQILDPRVIAPTMVESLEIQMECVNHTRLNVKEKRVCWKHRKCGASFINLEILKDVRNQPHERLIPSLGGRGWIRTTEVVDNRFTVCPLWPLGNSSI